MATARVFRCGNSQAVRLPRQFHLRGPEVEVFRQGDQIVPREKPHGMARAFELLADLPDDFMSGGRKDQPPQSRYRL